MRPHYRLRCRPVSRAIGRHIRCAGIGRGALHRTAGERGSFVTGNAGGYVVRSPRPRGPTAMTGARSLSAAGFKAGGGSAGNRVPVRVPDTCLPPFRLKATAFPCLHIGASVGERAARKRSAEHPSYLPSLFLISSAFF